MRLVVRIKGAAFSDKLAGSGLVNAATTAVSLLHDFLLLKVAGRRSSVPDVMTFLRVFIRVRRDDSSWFPINDDLAIVHTTLIITETQAYSPFGDQIPPS
jgi:hypothetical protein